MWPQERGWMGVEELHIFAELKTEKKELASPCQPRRRQADEDESYDLDSGQVINCLTLQAPPRKEGTYCKPGIVGVPA